MNFNNKKAQLKIQEMAFMLVGVFLFFVLVGLFALSVIYSGVQKSATEIEEQKASVVVVNLAGSAEFTCGKPNCVDGDKLVGMARNQDYRFFWPTFSSLRVTRKSGIDKIREAEETETSANLIECNLATYPNCDEYIIFDREYKETTISSFVALCRLEKDNTIKYPKCEIAKLEVGVTKD